MSMIIVLALGAIVVSIISALGTARDWVYWEIYWKRIRHNRPYPVRKNRVDIY